MLQQNHVSLVPIDTLSLTVGRSPRWCRRKISRAGGRAGTRLPTCTIREAVQVALAVDADVLPVVRKFRLARPTRITAASGAACQVKTMERFYLDAAEYALKLIADTEILSRSIPGPPARGTQVLCRRFRLSTYHALQLIAQACDTTPSAVLDWAIHQYIAHTIGAIHA